MSDMCEKGMNQKIMTEWNIASAFYVIKFLHAIELKKTTR
jgi:hypothetical protein